MSNIIDFQNLKIYRTNGDVTKISYIENGESDLGRWANVQGTVGWIGTGKAKYSIEKTIEINKSYKNGKFTVSYKRDDVHFYHNTVKSISNLVIS